MTDAHPTPGVDAVMPTATVTGVNALLAGDIDRAIVQAGELDSPPVDVLLGNALDAARAAAPVHLNVSAGELAELATATFIDARERHQWRPLTLPEDPAAAAVTVARAFALQLAGELLEAQEGLRDLAPFLADGDPLTDAVRALVDAQEAARGHLLHLADVITRANL